LDQRPLLPLNRRFDSRSDGLFAIDDQGSATRICDALWHLGNATRADGSDAADIVKFLDCTGASRVVVLPRKDSAITTARMFERLADNNFDVPQWKATRDHLVSYLAECRRAPKRTFLLVDRMGWHGNSFVIGTDVIAHDAVIDIRLDGPLAKDVDKFGLGGTSDEYRKNVLERARYSSRLMTGLALALLAPLAHIIGLENGGINFVGDKGIGRTSILRVIGSFWGGGKVEYYKTWG
jgi:hypothetical protein